MRRDQSWRSALTVLCIAGAMLAVLEKAEAGPPPGQVTLVVGGGPGTGYDRYGRTAMRHFEPMLPGGAKVVVQNMPGAGGVRAANWLYNVAPKDGTAMGTMPSAMVTAPLLGMNQAKYDPAKFGWLVSFNNLSNIVTIWHEAPFTSARDLFEKEIVLGDGGGPDSAALPILLNRLIHTKFKVVPGYQDSGDVALAMERGEVHGTVNLSWDSLKASRASWIAKKQVRILLQITLDKVPELGDTAFAMDYVKSDEDKQIIEILLAKQKLGRPILTPPGVPADTIAWLRKAFWTVANDPAFLAEAKKRRLDIAPVTGESIETFVKHVYDLPQSVVMRARSELELAKAGFPKKKKK